MLSNDCKECFTRVEFSQTTIQTNFDEIDRVLSDKNEIKMFMVDDYVFEFIEYVKEEEDSQCTYWVIGRYLTPIPHMTYMLEEEIQFKLDEFSINRFTFFSDNELVISMHGMLFVNGEFRENLIHKFNLIEIHNLTNDLCSYLLRTYCGCSNEMINIQNAFKSIGLYNHAKEIKND